MQKKWILHLTPQIAEDTLNTVLKTMETDALFAKVAPQKLSFEIMVLIPSMKPGETPCSLLFDKSIGRSTSEQANDEACETVEAINGFDKHYWTDKEGVIIICSSSQEWLCKLIVKVFADVAISLAKFSEKKSHLNPS